MTNSTNERIGAGNELPTQRAILVAVLALSVVGFYLRYRCLGCLGFRWDEDLTSLAVKALVEKGVPELPSGMIYLRFYLYQWVLAASVSIFDFSEYSLRLPGVVLGTLLIPTSYWVTKRFQDSRVALIVAACIAVSFWQIEMARTARMYAPFFLSYLIAAFAIYRVHFQNPDRIFSPWVLILAILCLSIHQLAYSLALLLLLAIPLNRSWLRTLSLVAQAGAIGAAFIAIKSVQERFFYIARTSAEATTLSEPVNDGGGPLGAILQQVSLPNVDLLGQVVGAHPVAFFACLLASLLLAAKAVNAARIGGGFYTAVTTAAIGFSVAHQFNLVVMLLVLMLIMRRGGLNGIREQAWFWPATCCLVIFCLWLGAIGIIGSIHPAEVALADQGYRKLLRALVDYPNFRLFWSFILERPLLSLPLALGTLWGIDRISTDRTDGTALFLIGSFWLTLFANGILKTKFEFFRYNLHIDPFYLILVVTGLLALPGLIAKIGVRLSPRWNDFFSGRVWVAIVATIAVIGVNPLAAVLTTSRDYRESGILYRLFDLYHYDDFATPGTYVREHLKDDDLVLTLDPREYWNYIGRVDYWIWSSNYESQTFEVDGRARDLYLNIPVLHSFDDVNALLSTRNGRDAWIIFSRVRLSRTKWVSDELKAFLGSLDDHIVFVGQDAETVVIHLTD